jgi:hypothetical protein
VGASHDDNDALLDEIQNAVWKIPQPHTPNLVIDFLEEIGILGQLVHRIQERTQEAVAKARMLKLIPIDRPSQFGSGLPVDDQLQTHEKRDRR